MNIQLLPRELEAYVAGQIKFQCNVGEPFCYQGRITNLTLNETELIVEGECLFSHTNFPSHPPVWSQMGAGNFELAVPLGDDCMASRDVGQWLQLRIHAKDTQIIYVLMRAGDPGSLNFDELIKHKESIEV